MFGPFQTKLQRRKRAASVAVLSVAMSLAFVACGGEDSGGDGGQVTLRYSFTHLGDNAVFTYGIEQGIFEDEGIDLELLEGKGSATTAQTVERGTDDFGLVDGGAFLNLASQGLRAKAVFGMQQISPFGILSPADDPIEKPEDLPGKELSMTAGGPDAPILAALLEQSGISEDSFKQVAMQPGPKLTSLLTGRVDGTMTTATVGASLESQGLETHMFRYADHLEIPGQYLVVSDSLLKDDPDVVERFVRAVQKSYLATQADPEAAAESFAATYDDYTAEKALAELELTLPYMIPEDATDTVVGSMDGDKARTLLDILVKFSGAESGADATDFLDDGYLSSDVKWS